jgi:hypothetical protein
MYKFPGYVTEHKRKEAMIRKLDAVIPEIVSKQKRVETLNMPWEDDLINQLNPVLETDIVHVRNKEID